MEKEILKDFLNNGSSIHTISKITGKSYSTIRYWLKKYNFFTNFKSFKDIDAKKIEDYKYCSMCKKSVKITEYYIRSDNKKPSTYCKICSNEKRKINSSDVRKQFRKNNPLSLEEIGEKISNGIKNYYKNNPEKHPWKNNNKFKSVPCENFKKILNEMNIKYIDEFVVSDKRLFSVDILIPEYKIIFEINGNQHYNKDGTLKEYYQIRHDFIINLGYKIYELHYSLFFNKEKMINLITSILADNKELFDFDYNEYLVKKLNRIKKEKKYKLCVCGKKINIKSDNCNSCTSIKRRKVIRPPYQILEEDIKLLGYTATGKKYGVSRTSIKKWLK